MAIAEARGIWKRFDGRDVVQDVSFTVESGDILGLVGPNGAGKTTTIACSWTLSGRTVARSCSSTSRSQTITAHC